MIFKNNDTDFFPGLQGFFQKHPAIFFWAFPLFLFFLIVTLIFWMVFTQTDVITQAQGQIILNEGKHLIQSKQIGMINTVPVSQGDIVKKGDLLVSFDVTDVTLEQEKILKNIYLLKGNIYRYESLISSLTYVNKDILISKEIPRNLLISQNNLINHQLTLLQLEENNLEMNTNKRMIEYDRLQLEIQKLEILIKNLEKKINRLQPLVKDRLVSSEEYEQYQQDLILKTQDQKMKQIERASMKVQIQQSKNQQNLYVRDFLNSMQEKLLHSYQELETLEANYKQSNALIKNRFLYSPIDGIVHHVTIYTKGSVVQAGELIMEVLPQNPTLQVKANILNRDIGFIYKDQFVKFKVDSFSFTKYGFIKGKILKIEHAAIKDEQLGDIYPIIVELTDNRLKVDGKWVFLKPGMTGTLDIQTGKRQLIEYILTPFLRYKDEALKER